MRGLVWRGAGKLSLEDVPEPIPGAGEVVIDVELAGICGSDLHPYRGNGGPRVPPLILGHEAIGWLGGERYSIYPLIGCAACDSCAAGMDNLCASWRLLGMHRAGAFAERVAVPRSALVPVPAEVDAEHAVQTEPLACCLGALDPHEVGEGTRVLVLGCGPIGLLTVFSAARLGAEVLAVDVVANRRAQAARLGARCTLAPGAEIPSGSIDLVVDAAGFQDTWRVSLDAVRNGGAVVVIGLGQPEGTLRMASLVRRTITLRGQFAYTRDQFAAALRILADGDLDLGWVSEVGLDDGASAFANLVERPEDFVKVLLRP